MWKHKLDKISRTILSNYPYDFANLSCIQFRPNQDLEYGLPVQSGKSVFLMIKPESNVLGLYVLSDESYHSSLSVLGEIKKSSFDFSDITERNSLFLAVHTDGHFYEKINVANVIKEISTFAHINNSTFLIQLDTVDLNLSRLASKISERLAHIREPIKVKRESGNYTKDHKERHRDLDNFGDEILKSFSFGVCSSAVIWCFSPISPSIGFAGSKASVSWVNVDSRVISQTVSFGDKFKRLFKKSKYSKIQDVFNTNHQSSNLIRFDILRVLRKEVSRYLRSRKNSPVFFFDGDVTLHQKNIQSSKSVDSDNQSKSESFQDIGY